jgi:hypothetical protein
VLVLATTFSVIGDTIMTILKIRFRFKPTHSGKILVGGRNFGSGLQENMLLGQFTTMVSDVWYPAFLLIF